jgi:tubulin-like protein/TIR domain-containing protein
LAMQALVMGFGGTGAHILTALKELTVLKNGRVPASIKFLLFDTIADWEPGKVVQILGGAAQEKLAAGSEKATSLDPNTEYFYLADHDPDLKTYVFKHLSPAGEPDRYPHLKDWLHAPWFRKHAPEDSLSIGEYAAQQRQVGRFAMFNNHVQVAETIRYWVKELSLHTWGAPINVWVAGSAAGGTGAGCFLDAAYLTRLVTDGLVDIKLTGVIVLPDVYSGMPGISRARAYSLLREMDRAQEQGLMHSDRYVEKGKIVSSAVKYDVHGQYCSRVSSKLFDDLFYLSARCDNEVERARFFASVGSAMDPYLDERSGPLLLQESLNYSAAASSFGAARLYVPLDAIIEVFAWEQVLAYLRGMTAPVEREGRVIGIAFGAPADRAAEAEKKIRNMLPLYAELIDRSRRGDFENKKHLQNVIHAERIITRWYQFTGSAIVGKPLTPVEANTILLTYINPYISLIEAEDYEVAPEDLITKTYNENKLASGPGESQEVSRDRFAEELEEVTAGYTDLERGDGTFEKGRRLVIQEVSNLLIKKVDEMVTEELKRKFTISPAHESSEEGTALTRLVEEIRCILMDGGPLKIIEHTVAKFVAILNDEEKNRIHQMVEAVRQLRLSKRPRLLTSLWIDTNIWVEIKQQEAREEMAEYIRWHQKRALLKDTQIILRGVVQRFEKWQKTLTAILDCLVLQEESSILNAVQEILDQKKLARQSNWSTFETDVAFNFELMQEDYVDELRRKSIFVTGEQRLADTLLADSRWGANIGADGTPYFRLTIFSGFKRTYAADNIDGLHKNLYDYFREEIAKRLEYMDIFDYLVFIKQKYAVQPGDIAAALSKQAKTLINTATASEESKLIYKEPIGEDKLDLAFMIQAELQRFSSGIVRDPERLYSDPHSIILLKITKPNLEDVINVEDCKQAYADLQVADLTGFPDHDNQILRAQTHHIFSSELEAWHIERWYWKAKFIHPGGFYMPPRVVRLLERPDMVQAFVHCVATGAVEKMKGKGWVWHDTQKDREVMLVDEENDPDADLLTAAVIFVLQQRDRRKKVAIPITLEGARQSVQDMANKKGKAQEVLLRDFINSPAAMPAAIQPPTRIFLNYARVDKEAVEALYQRLSDAGLFPWMDTKDIQPGRHWPSTTREAIEQADFFLVCLTPRAIIKRGEFRQEIKFAFKVWQQQPDREKYIIPIRMENCALPESLNHLQWVDLSEEGAWEKLLRVIQAGRADEPSPDQPRGRPTRLEQFLNRHCSTRSTPAESQEVKEALKMVFEFYCDPQTSIGLLNRVNLP